MTRNWQVRVIFGLLLFQEEKIGQILLKHAEIKINLLSRTSSTSNVWPRKMREIPKRTFSDESLKNISRAGENIDDLYARSALLHS